MQLLHVSQNQHFKQHARINILLNKEQQIETLLMCLRKEGEKKQERKQQ